MQATLDLKVVELLSARMCHDLISPVAAIGNGIELITEFEDQMQGEALALIGDSACAASGLLQFYRAAFGSARSTEGAGLGLAEARARTVACLGKGRIQLAWPEEVETNGRDVSRLGIKLLLSLVLAAFDVLPGTGTVTVSFVPGESALHVEITAARDGFILPEEFRAALSGAACPDDLTPRTVVGYFCRSLAGSLGQPFEILETPSEVRFAGALPWA